MTPTQQEALRNGVCSVDKPPMLITLKVVHRLGQDPFHLWQCSISMIEKGGGQMLTSRWTDEILQRAIRVGEDVLYGVGNGETTNVELSASEYVVRRRFSQIDLNELRLINDAF